MHLGLLPQELAAYAAGRQLPRKTGRAMGYVDSRRPGPLHQLEELSEVRMI